MRTWGRDNQTLKQGGLPILVVELSLHDVRVGTLDYNAWVDKLTVLERFNGRTYQPVPAGNGAVNLTLYHASRAEKSGWKMQGMESANDGIYWRNAA